MRDCCPDQMSNNGSSRRYDHLTTSRKRIGHPDSWVTWYLPNSGVIFPGRNLPRTPRARTHQWDKAHVADAPSQSSISTKATVRPSVTSRTGNEVTTLYILKCLGTRKVGEVRCSVTGSILTRSGIMDAQLNFDL